jgi:hypothetical protein
MKTIWKCSCWSARYDVIQLFVWPQRLQRACMHVHVFALFVPLNFLNGSTQNGRTKLLTNRSRSRKSTLSLIKRVNISTTYSYMLLVCVRVEFVVLVFRWICCHKWSKLLLHLDKSMNLSNKHN